MENLQNLYSTTLSSSYTAGAGSIAVAAAPAAGNGTYTMTLVIRDATTKAVKLLFRVTSVSGTTLTGAAEGTDANAASGDLVDGSIISVASQSQLFTDHHGYGTFANLPATTGRAKGDRYKCSDSEYDMVFDGTIWRPAVEGIVCVRPDISTFTNHGGAPTASDNTRGPFHFNYTAPNNSYNWSMYTKAIPSAPWTVTLGFRGWFLGNPAEQAYFGIVLRKSATGQFWAYGGGDNPDGDGVIFFTDPTTFGGSNPRSVANIKWAYGRTIFVRVVDDGTTNWVSYIGWGNAVDPNDPSTTNWIGQYTQSRNPTITPDECGFGMSLHNDSGRQQVMEVVHFSATSP